MWMSDGRSHRPEIDRERLRARVDSLLAAGRITTEEAARVRAADDPAELDLFIRAIQRRHATEWVDRQVATGRLDPEAADAMRRRLAAGEDPRAIWGSHRTGRCR